MSQVIAPKVSIILACYCEEESVDTLYRGIVNAMQTQHREYELIFINDGSTDGTMNRLLQIWENDPRVVLIDLVRNSGQWPAMTAGIEVARGECLAFMDCDLQLDPADIPPLLDKYDEGYDLVSGNRTVRRDSPLRRIYSRVGNFLLRGLTKGQLSDLGCALKACNGAFIRAFEFGPMTPFRFMQVLACIDSMAEVPVRHHPRRHGDSKWGSAVLIPNFALAMLDLLQGRVRFVGMVLWLVACLIILLAMLPNAIGFSAPFPPSVALVGLTIMVLGVSVVVADLLILSRVARRVRPAYIVRRIYRHPPPHKHAGE